MISPILQSAPLALMSPEIPRIVNFAIFAGVLIYFLRKPMMRFFTDRLDRIRLELEQARTEREEGRKQLRRIESRLNNLEVEITELKTKAAEEAEAEAERIKSLAETEADKIKALAQREIAGATNAARLELKEFAASQAVALATDIIRRNIRDEDHHSLIKNFTEQVEEVRR